MSKLIVEVEKVPKNCDDSCWGYLSDECPWSDHVDGYTMNGGRPRNCPIVGVLPEEHGRLVDADACLSVLRKLENEAKTNIEKLCYGYAARMFEEAVTIIAAEKKDKKGI